MVIVTGGNRTLEEVTFVIGLGRSRTGCGNSDINTAGTRRASPASDYEDALLRRCEAVVTGRGAFGVTRATTLGGVGLSD